MKDLILLTLSPWLLAIHPASVEALTSRTVAQTDHVIAQAGRTYIGLRYRDLPRGLTSLGGWMLTPQRGTEYGVSVVQRGNQRMLWLERLIDRDAQGRASWEVRDVLLLPAIPQNFDLAQGWCELNRRADARIVAIARYQNSEYSTQIRRAWRANWQRERFEEMPTRGIRCQNPGFGV
ncbi:MAG TPA: hypothetical protein IGS37_16800 [Synechococcales cyanobacterium M55_K2018_004]|nr:hypothetical protein [Synechococcales cyanobacterium M55_K2018_004]